MALAHFFDGAEQIIPGPYAVTKGVEKNSIPSLSAGNTLIINTGTLESNFTGTGSGVNGTLAQDSDAVYSFTDLKQFQRWIRGGAFYKLAEALFEPEKGFAGVSSLTYINAATSLPAKLVLSLGGIPQPGVAPPLNQSVFTFWTKEENEAANASGLGSPDVPATATVSFNNPPAAGSRIRLLANINGVADVIVGQITGPPISDNPTFTTAAQAMMDSITTIGKIAVASAIDTSTPGFARFQVKHLPGVGAKYSPTGFKMVWNDGVGDTFVEGWIGGGVLTQFSGGVDNNYKLTGGYAFRIVKDYIDDTKYVIQLWRGRYRGTDGAITLNPVASTYDGIKKEDTTPELVAKSPALSTVKEVYDWAKDITGTGELLNQYVTLIEREVGGVPTTSVSEVAGSTNLLPRDLNTVSAPYWKFGEAGVGAGASTYSADDLTAALDAAQGDYDFILLDRFGTNASDLVNLQIMNSAKTLKVKPSIYAAGGSVKTDFTQSLNLCKLFDSEQTTVVHGGCRKTDPTGKMVNRYKSIYTAAALLGREAGMQAQVPLTFKSIDIDGLEHSLSQIEIEKGLRAGLLMLKQDGGTFDVIKGVNTLQKSAVLINPDGSSHSKQFSRINRQLKKELVYAAKLLLKNPTGTNRNTLSAADVKTFVESFLMSKTASKDKDNLILSYQNITVELRGDAYDIEFEYTVNSEISFLFFTAVSIN